MGVLLRTVLHSPGLKKSFHKIKNLRLKKLFTTCVYVHFSDFCDFYVNPACTRTNSQKLAPIRTRFWNASMSFRVKPYTIYKCRSGRISRICFRNRTINLSYPLVRRQAVMLAARLYSVQYVCVLKC